MTIPNRMLHLNLFLTSLGHHEAAWRHPASDPSHQYDIQWLKQLAIKAEQAKFDSIFLADRLAVSKTSVQHGGGGGLEPLTLLSALSAVTENIGLIGTVSTSFNEPYNLARRLASLDHISGGRAGWNIVTSGTDGEARNFNYDYIPGHKERYDRAREFVEVAIKLWDSWEDDAVLLDKENGLFADSEKVHELNHEGLYYKVKGPLNISRSPQGRPVLVQAGSSDDGRDFAAQFAEAVFTAHQSLTEAQAFYHDVKKRALQFGRSPHSIVILPGICPIIGRTAAEAKEKEQEIQRLSNLEHSLHLLSNRVGVDLTGYPLDEPFPELPDTNSIQGHQSRTKLIVDMANRENLTLGQLLLRLTGGRGHYTITGTAEQIADHMEHWFQSGAADGFNIMPQVMTGGLEDFIDGVVPELRRRGLFRTDYTGKTLREHYALDRPSSQFAITPPTNDVVQKLSNISSEIK